MADVAADLGLDQEWLNEGPTDLLRPPGLPVGFLDRCKRLRFGSLSVRVASRIDQIHLKLFATTDQWPGSRHAADLNALAPTREELVQAAAWCRSHDPSPGFAALLDQVLGTWTPE